jgi:hypothetical protein
LQYVPGPQRDVEAATAVRPPRAASNRILRLLCSAASAFGITRSPHLQSEEWCLL